MSANRYISQKIKKLILEIQLYKCANNPNNPALNLSDYNCLLWICYDGVFDNSGYEFDHINEYCISKDNSIDNIQALCPYCHSVKTKKFMKQKKDFTTIELHNGRSHMDTGENKKKRKI